MTDPNSPLIPKRILIRSVNWLGDAIMTLPALTALKETFPTAKLLLLTPQKLAGLWEKQPLFDKIISFDKKDSLLKTVRSIKSLKADSALILPNSPRTAMETYLGKIPLRAGIRAKWRKLLLTHAFSSRTNISLMKKRSLQEISALSSCNCDSLPTESPFLPGSHHIYHYIYLVSKFIQIFTGTPLDQNTLDLTPKLSLSREEQQLAIQKFGISYPSLLPLMGVNAGAEYGPAKRWPIENFAQTMILLTQQQKAHWIIFGGPNDINLAEVLQKQLQIQCPEMKVYNVAGKTSLRELLLLSGLTQIFLTNDTGPMHAAAAVGATVAVPFLSTSPELTSPGAPLESKTFPNSHILLKPNHSFCSPCFLRKCPIDFRCARQITPEIMVSKITAFLKKSNSQSNIFA